MGGLDVRVEETLFEIIDIKAGNKRILDRSTPSRSDSNPNKNKDATENFFEYATLVRKEPEASHDPLTAERHKEEHRPEGHRIQGRVHHAKRERCRKSCGSPLPR